MKARRIVLCLALPASIASAAVFGALALACGRPAPAVLVRSVPGEASVYVDGVFRGVTPLELERPSRDPRPLRLEKTGYETFFGVLGAARRGPEESLRLEPVATGGLDVRSEPPGAEVFLDGEFRGVTPVSLDRVRVGPHILLVEKTNHDPRALSVLVSRDERLVARLELEDRILRYLEHAARESPDDLLVHMELGHYCMVARRPEKSARVFCRALTLARRPETKKNHRRKLELQIKRDRRLKGGLGARMGAELDRLMRGHKRGAKP